MDMETEAEKLTYVVAERNYVRCLTEGVMMGINNLGTLLRYAWPALLLVCFVSALTAVLTEMQTQDVTMPFVISTVVLMILSAVSFIIFAGTIDAMIVRWRELGYEPAVSMKTLRPLIQKRVVRDSCLLLVYLPALAIVTAGTVLPLYLGLPLWTALVAFVVLLALCIPLDLVMMDISYSDKPLGRCIASYVRGWRYFGRLFAFDFTCYLFVTLFAFLPLLPMLAVAMVNAKANQAQAIGDLVDLPAYYPVLSVLAYVLSTAVSSVLLIIWSHAHALLWGSIEENESKRKADKEAQVSEEFV